MTAGALDMRDFEAFFGDATGFAPYDWQVRVALDGLPDVLPVPTGLGKTEGAVLAWAWRRLRVPPGEPLHLVYCLPMRSLVRQTVDRLERYFDALATKRGVPRVNVHQLMGGAIDEKWARWPDRPWVLVGTQDQLLSRALNRGYAMSRFEWPVHFGLLNQDCRWIVDEVQLMGPGLWATAQLDWMRRKRFLALKPCVTTWMSATVGAGFLATTDRKKDGLDTVELFDPRLDQNPNEELRWRRSARRQVGWLEPSTGKRAAPIHEQIASRAHAEHRAGTLTLVVCNTVDMAQQVFRSLPDQPPKILLTSRFRRCDRRDAEQRLLEFEAHRSKEARLNPAAKGGIKGDLGLVCVSTQVIEAGVDISAHHLWSELASWPSIVQRLGRLNRDGRDNDARARFWKVSKGQEQKRNGDVWVGPYRRRDLDDAVTLLSALIRPSSEMPLAQAIGALEHTHRELLRRTLEPAPAPLPRALDVHGLFSTERDVHGGFTDVSAFVRGSDPDADVIVFWRLWSGAAPPRGEALDGPPLDLDADGCAVAFYRVRDVLKSRPAKAWIWNDEDERWEPCGPDDLRPGMVVMLHRDIGGYDVHLGWTGEGDDRLDDVARAGRARALQGDERTEIGYWATLGDHLQDARAEAERICDALGLRDVARLRSYRQAVVEAAGLHDLGKAHPKWQAALPSGGMLGAGPWAKCPRVVAVDVRSGDQAVRAAIAGLRPTALPLAPPLHRSRRGAENRRGVVRLRWAVDQMLSRLELHELKGVPGVAWAGHVSFRPGMRHEAASALAMWKWYREGRASYPALAVYLAAAHHGKVRTVLRATSPEGDDVFGVGREPDTLHLDGQAWPLDFSVAADGAAGEWREGNFVLTDHGWTGLVADLLGPWRGKDEDSSEIGAVPEGEPRRLGPFALAWLEALVRVADWRASEHPSRSFKPGELGRGE